MMKFEQKTDGCRKDSTRGNLNASLGEWRRLLTGSMVTGAEPLASCAEQAHELLQQVKPAG